MNAGDFEVKFADELEDEIKEIFRWYLSQSPRAGNKFIESLDELFKFLSLNPFSYKKQKKNFRVAFLKKFPYSVIYEITGTVVLILRIIHSARHPKRRFVKLIRR